MRVLYAPNVHQGGGRALLLPLLEALKNANDVVFVLDARMELPVGMDLLGKVYRVSPTLLSRLFFEWRMLQLIQDNEVVLCMGNLPPLFAHQGVQRVFVQNRYLIDDVSLSQHPLPVRLRLKVERWWLRSRSSYVQQFIVQTESMQRCIKTALAVEAEVRPFVDRSQQISQLNTRDGSQQYDFLYVASGESHKNHQALVRAWIVLADRDVYPSLCLTLDANRFASLCAWIESEIHRTGVRISMIGECSFNDVQKLYRQSSALIYPSLFESFGLPLMEAVYAGLPVLASNELFVTDVIEPSAQFDANSSQSIADAVQSFQYQSAKVKIKLLNADEFLRSAFL